MLAMWLLTLILAAGAALLAPTDSATRTGRLGAHARTAATLLVFLTLAAGVVFWRDLAADFQRML